MQHEHIERTWELRASPYYGGRLDLRLMITPPYPGVLARAELAWSSYEGGSVTLDLDDDEVEALHAALGEYLAIDRKALRDEHLAAWHYAEELDS